MRLLGRSSGAVYRVYDEDDYVDGEAPRPTDIDSPDPIDIEGPGSIGVDGPVPIDFDSPGPIGVDGPGPTDFDSRAEARPRPRSAALAGFGLLFVVVASAAVLVLDTTARRPLRHAPVGSSGAPERAWRPPARPPARPRPEPVRSRSTRVRVGIGPAHARSPAATGDSAPSVPAAAEPTAELAVEPAGGDAQPAGGEFGFER